jgi:hypothetical protein
MQSLSSTRTDEPQPIIHHSEPFLASGRFVIGANYWASHAGTFMWRDWDAEVVKEDFRRLAEGGLTVLRIFPLWTDFQPIQCLRRENSTPVDFRHGETPLASGPIGQSGVSTLMLKRLERLCDLAENAGLRLVVGLITGWMSGRLFVPPALEGLNHLTDPASLIWQVRLVTALVRQMRGHPAISAWDLGNECNCLDRATKDQAWLWTASIANAIRACDPVRPVISGMHSLPADSLQPWAIRDQGELTDILTTHPYPLFTQHCNREPMDTLRPLLHGTVETCLYADISGKPAFVEETGNFGPAFCDEETAAEIARVQAYSLWAHDCRGLLWWCAHEQSELTHAPYDWISMERELGLLRTDGSTKPVFNALSRASANINNLPIDRLPPRRIDAICILTEGQDQWAAAYTSFLLAKQAGFDIEFCYGDRPLPDSPFYLLPSINNLRALSRRREMELRERVEAGATLYVSAEDGFLGEIMKMTGLHVRGRFGRKGPCEFSFANQKFSIAASTQFHLEPGSATVLAEEGGAPVFSVMNCGKGRVFFLAAPLETSLAGANGAFLATAASYWKIYARLWAYQVSQRHIGKDNPSIGITEHPLPDGSLIAVLINYQPERSQTNLTFSDGYRFHRALTGIAPSAEAGSFSLLPNAVAVWEFSPT